MRLPPLHALMVFDVTGQHESFLKAAKELNITPGAVSRQIKKLEEAFGMPLFTRSHRKVRLTEGAKEYWSCVHEHLSQLGKETEKFASHSLNRRLTVRCSMMFMRYWLMPRLSGFYDAFPRLDVGFQIVGSSQPTTAEEDCSIRAGSGEHADLVSEYLLDASNVPICSPSYLKKSPSLLSISDLAHQTLLHSRDNEEAWSQWIGTPDHEVISSAKHIYINGDGLLYQAAIEGLGVVLGRPCLVAAELAAGRLVLPLGIPDAEEEGYYFVYKAGKTPPPGFREFRGWLSKEARRHRSSQALPKRGLLARSRVTVPAVS